MGLQTGAKLGQISKPLIDPVNLAIVAYEIDGSLLSETPSFLRIADIRELSSIGIIIDSNDEFIGVKDVIKIENLYKLRFNLVGMLVIDKTGHKLGKVDDYVVDNSSFYIKQLSIKHSGLKSFNETGKLIDRSNIIEINDSAIIVKSAQKAEPVNEVQNREFINPFKTTTPQADSIDT